MESDQFAGQLVEYRKLERSTDLATVESGSAVVSGTITDSNPKTAPFSAAPAVAFTARITADSTHFRNETELIHHETDSSPFTITDSTGRIRVDPSAVVIRGSPSLWAPVDPENERIPSRISTYLEHRNVSIDTKPHVFTEIRVEPGEPVTAFGEVRTTGGERILEGNPLILECGKAETVRRRYARLVFRGSRMAVLLALCGYLGLAVTLGG